MVNNLQSVRHNAIEKRKTKVVIVDNVLAPRIKKDLLENYGFIVFGKNSIGYN